MAGKSDIDLDEVAKNLAKELSSDEHIQALGKAFGFSRREVDRYIDNNYRGRNIGFHGTESMINDWIEKFPKGSSKADILDALRKKLVEAKLVRISETLPTVFIDKKEPVTEGACKAEEEDEGLGTEIEPDGDGYYTQPVQEAHPTPEQLDPNKSYKMDSSKNKGVVFILNNINFLHKPEKKRTGSENDVKNAVHVFEQIGYTPSKHKDLRAEKILEQLDELVKEINANAPKHSSVVLVLMSHGGIDKKSRQYIQGTDWKPVKCKDIIEKFSETNCPALKNKPKIIFIQACRGVENLTLVGQETHVKDQNTSEQDGDLAMDAVVPSEPAIADLYLMNATAEEFGSMRSKVKGSWFIQALCEELLANAHKDHLDAMMTRVRKKVHAQKANMKDNGEKITVIKQVPESKSRLLRDMYFLPKYPHDQP